MKKGAGYTLEMFAEAPIHPKRDLWAAGHDWSRTAFVRRYRRQCAWNDRMADLLADSTPWESRPVPVSDWSPKGMRAWHRKQMEPFIRDLYSALDENGRAYRLFAQACHKARPRPLDSTRGVDL
jgi:hypothetical protein